MCWVLFLARFTLNDVDTHSLELSRIVTDVNSLHCQANDEREREERLELETEETRWQERQSDVERE